MKNVILIPGITGTTLVNSNSIDFDTIYSGIERYFEDMMQMSLTENGLFDESPELIIERNKVEALAYKEIVNLLPKDQYRTYIFGYDWRKSNYHTAQELDRFVKYLGEKLGESSFYFITHSMGALVFQAYLQLLNGNYSSITKAALTVPPFKGAAEPIKALTVGVTYMFNSREKFRKVARTLPSMFELLPDYQDAFYFKNGTPANVFDAANWQSNIYPDFAPGTTTPPAAAVLFARRLAAAKNFRTNQVKDLSTLPTDIREKLVILTGQNKETMTSVSIEPTDPTGHITNFFDLDLAYPKNGDGTVPYLSSHYYKNSITTIEVENDFLAPLRYKLFLNQHAGFLNDSRVQSIIKRFFNNEDTRPNWWSVVGGTTKKV